MTQRLTVDTTFPHAYECHQLDELPNSDLPLHHFQPHATSPVDHDGIILKVVPQNGSAWIGMFAFGRISPNGLSGIFTTPDETRLCVVARGAAYLVIASEPNHWQYVDETPIMDVRCNLESNLIILASFTRLLAYDSRGLKWKTDSLTYGDLKIVNVTDKYIDLEFWNAPRGKVGKLKINLTDGSQEGGAPRTSKS